MKEEELFEKRLQDLADASFQNNQYTFTGFLTPMEYSLFLGIEAQLHYANPTTFGGTKDCQRKMLRFGDMERLGYEEPFPIVCLKAVPLAKKFADKLTHRDFLGALMNLGIERNQIGDLCVRDNVGYFFVTTRMADYICTKLSRVKHTSVLCKQTDDIPDDWAGTLVERTIQADSERIDGMVARVYNLSRSQAAEQFRAQKVFVNGALCENFSRRVQPGDEITLRGKGKFIYDGILSQSKKGHYQMAIREYRG